MKKLTTPAGLFGPFQTIEVMDDRYRCDGADLPFVVVGEGTIEDAVPEDFPPRESEPASAPAPTKEQLMTELAALSAKIQALE